MEVLNRAFSDTFQHLGRLPAILLMVGGAVAGWLFLGVVAGSVEMREGTSSFQAGLMGIGSTTLALFLFNLAAAPYRIERDRASATHQRNLELSEAVRSLEDAVRKLSEQKPHLEMQILHAFLGGSSSAFPGRVVVGAGVRLANIGEKRSPAEDWLVEAVLNDGRTVPLRIVHIGGTTSMMNTEGEMVSFGEKDFIYEKTAAPVEPGTVTGGYIISWIAGTMFKDMIEMKISCRDILGQTVLASRDLNPERKTNPLSHVPYLGGKFSRISEEGDK